MEVQQNYITLMAKIEAWAHQLGFQAVGVSDIDLSKAEQQMLSWLAQGFHGEMDYMAKHGVKRSRPAELVPGTIRVISVRMNYLSANTAPAKHVLQNASQAYISRYALGRDYHKVLRNRLSKLADLIKSEIADYQGRIFVDSAPVLEVALAQQAGLGWRGKHSLLINRTQGSYFFLGEIYINLPLPLTIHDNNSHCGRCVRCIDICPTRAIVAPYVVDARLCISYLTIEFNGSIPETLRPLIGNRIYGCDDCQMVCPWNRFAQWSLEPDFVVRHGLDNVTLLQLFAWDETEFDAKMAGSAIYRIGYEKWLRNIAIALGNAPKSAEVVQALQVRSASSSALVREHVLWALHQQLS